MCYIPSALNPAALAKDAAGLDPLGKDLVVHYIGQPKASVLKAGLEVLLPPGVLGALSIASALTTYMHYTLNAYCQQLTG